MTSKESAIVDDRIANLVVGVGGILIIQVEGVAHSLEQQRIASFDRFALLVLDDWGVAPLTAEPRRDLLEILALWKAFDPGRRPGSGGPMA